MTRFSTERRMAEVPANASTEGWTLNLTNPVFNHTSLAYAGTPAVLSSTRNSIVAPRSVIDRMQAIICGETLCSTGYSPTWNCSLYSASPITFTLGAANVSLDTALFVSSSLGRCHLSLSAGEDAWVLGVPFVQKYFLVFDAERGTVMMALAKQESRLTPLAQKVILIGAAVVGLGWLLVKACKGSQTHEGKKKE